MKKEYKHMNGVGGKKFNPDRRKKGKSRKEIEDGIQEHEAERTGGDKNVQRAIEREPVLVEGMDEFEAEQEGRKVQIKENQSNQPTNRVGDILEPLSTGKKGDHYRGKATPEEIEEIKKRGEKEGVEEWVKG